MNYDLFGRLVQQIHESHCLGFHFIYHTVHQRHQVIVGEHGDDAHNQTAYRSNHGLVYTAGKQGDVDIVTGIRHFKESTHHTGHRTQETNHRSAARNGSHDGQPLFQFRHFDVADILYGCLHHSPGVPTG